MKSVLTITTACALALSSATAAFADCTNDVWNRVMSTGKLTVGVKADYKPWGFRDPSGALVGMEIDMAKEVANTMGVALELMPVQASNRIQFLEQGQIDLMIATMSDRKDRRKLVGIIGPNYYTSGTNVMARKDVGISNWRDLKGKTVCGKQGAFYNRFVERRFGAKIIAFEGNAEAKQALRDNKCVAWVYDDSSIIADLSSGLWDDYEMPLATQEDNPWGLAVAKDEENCIFGRFMAGMQYYWHRDGTLLDLERKWGIQPSDYLVVQHEKYSDWLN